MTFFLFLPTHALIIYGLSFPAYCVHDIIWLAMPDPLWVGTSNWSTVIVEENGAVT